MQNRHNLLRLRRRRSVATFATFIAAFTLACSGVAMAATGYVHMLKTARNAGPQLPTTVTVAPGCWQPPGCVFPGTSAFSRP